MKVLDLFSGIGGFSLGLERAGMETVAFCEIDKSCHKVLNKHWPEVKIYDDIKNLSAQRLRADKIGPISVICGGFPCQDISVAGKGAGIDGARSGLWAEYARLIGEIRPEYVIVENVSALLGRGLSRVLADLAQIGYDAEWHCIPASYVGAPHRRDRIWIVAYAGCKHGEQGNATELDSDKSQRASSSVDDKSGSSQFGDEKAVADTNRWEQSFRGISGRMGWFDKLGEEVRSCFSQWKAEPELGRVADGVPNRMDRLRQLGNAVVPQIPELIGRAILAGN